MAFPTRVIAQSMATLLHGKGLVDGGMANQQGFQLKAFRSLLLLVT